MGKRPDLAGKLLQAEGDPAIYLIDDDGTRRLVPDLTTLNNLFIDKYSVQQFNDINTIDRGPDITSGAILASANGVSLIDNYQKRHVHDPSVMTKFQFDWNKVDSSIPAIVLNCIADGPEIT